MCSGAPHTARPHCLAHAGPAVIAWQRARFAALRCVHAPTSSCDSVPTPSHVAVAVAIALLEATCPAPTLTVPARLACDGRRLMVLLAIVIERCVQRSQNVPSIALQLPLPRACFHVLLPLHSLCPLRAGR